MTKNLKKVSNDNFVHCGIKLLICSILILFVFNDLFKDTFSLNNSYDYYAGFLSRAFLTIALFFAIWNFERFYQYYKSSEKKQGLWYAVYFAVSIVLLFNPLDTKLNEVTRFNRVMGIGFIENVDVSKRIVNFSTWFMLLAFVFILFLLSANYILQNFKGEQNQKVISFLNDFIIIANVGLVFRCITFFKDELNSKIFHYSTNLIFLIVFFCLAYIVLNFDDQMPASTFFKLVFVGCLISFPISIFLKKEGSLAQLLFSIQSIILVVFILVVKISNKVFKTKQFSRTLTVGVMTLSTLPFVTSFYMEVVNILNQHSIFVTRVRRYYFFSICLILLIFLLLCFIAHKINWNFNNWKQLVYPCLIFGVSCLSVQISLEATYGAHIFESANSSVLISDFLKFGSIPLVEHYGGHMMTDVWEGLIYAFLNKDSAGAIFSPYSVYIAPVLSLLFFYLMKITYSEDFAFFVVLLFPFYSFWNYYGLGMLICLSVISYVKKNSYPRAVLVWFACIWCLIYRLDLGVAFGFACIITLVIYVIVFRNLKAIKQLLITLAGWITICAIAWVAICKVKGINATNRLVEFIMISASNVNWAYEHIGNAGNALFAWSYMFVPFLIIVCLICSVFSRNFRTKIGIEKWMLLLIFGFSYLVNFSRSIVRHSLVELCMFVVIWSGYIFISMFISCLHDNRKLFLPLFTTLILINTLFLQSANFEMQPILESAVSSADFHTSTWKTSYWSNLRNSGVPVTRVKWHDELKATINPYDFIINGLLDENETFVDFANKSFVYSAINRKSPVYVSQSPLQLSGDFTQNQFIKSMEGVPLVIMPLNAENCAVSLDGITNVTRYYRVAEYIYQKYVPLCRYENTFAVWCLRNRYNEMKDKVKDLISERHSQHELFNCEMINYGYDGPDAEKGSVKTERVTYTGELHNHFLGHLPRMWAEKDVKKSARNTVVTDLSKINNVYQLKNESIQRGYDGNYLLISANCMEEDIDDVSNKPKRGLVKLGTYDKEGFNEKYQYNMYWEKGKHNYLIRVSNDYYWYFGNINAVSIETDAKVQDVTMYILKGD